MAMKKKASCYLTLAAAFVLVACPIAQAEGQLSSAPDTDIEDMYPRVGTLENAILGQSYPKDPIADRLTRMEKKAFGKVSAKTDLADRTDDLDDYTATVLHKNLLQATMDVDDTQTANNQPGPTKDYYSNPVPSPSPSIDTADYPRVTALEEAILGQTYVGQSLNDRLGRMEMKAFGNVSNKTDLSDRTDALETYVEKTLHKPLLDKSGSQITSANPQASGGLFSKVGQALLGMAMPNMNGIGGTVGRGGGLGYGGGGLGGSGMGFGPVGNTRRQAAQQKEQEQQVPVHPDDPAVHADTPPDPSAKLIVKVGWCEVKLFGHTFPEMHLPQRLGQINDELKLESGKSNVQLMDDIGLMIKAVQARKPKTT